MKLKVVVLDLEMTGRQKRMAGAGLVLAVALSAGIALAAPKTFVAGETLKAADLNASFQDVDGRLSFVEAAASDAVSTSEINLTDPPESNWQAMATLCLTGSNDAAWHTACSVAANRKCVYDLDYKSGWFVGEFGSSGDSNTRLIVCVK